MSSNGSSGLALVTTSPYQVALFFEQQLGQIPDDIEIFVFSNTEDRYAKLTGLEVSHISIQRSSVLGPKDVQAIRALQLAFKANRIRTVVTMSPKAGLVGQLAAVSAGVQHRVHIFTGQVWQGLSNGPQRLIVRFADQVVGRLVTHLAADSPSQAQLLEEQRVAPRSKRVDVPHPAGSIRGVDIKKFRPDVVARATTRLRFNLHDDAMAFVQLGRISEAKGVLELGTAFARVRDRWRTAGGIEPRLFIVGEDEEGLSAHLASFDGIEVLEFTSQPEVLLAGMDVMVLASHREGFGSSIIEGAAVGLPSLGTDIVGVRDAIVDGQTGWLVPRRSPDSIETCLREILQSSDEVLRRGNEARKRAQEDFRSKQVVEAWSAYLVGIHLHGGEFQKCRSK